MNLRKLKIGDEVIVTRKFVRVRTCSGYRAWQNEVLCKPIKGIFIGTRRLEEGQLHRLAEGQNILETQVYKTVALVAYHRCKKPLYVADHSIEKVQQDV